MGRIIYLDGPEKAGKSTLARFLAAEYGYRVRHWGRVEGDHVYARQLAEDIHSPHPWVWDRGWAAEHVYAHLLQRDRRLGPDPWLGEWLYGRAVDTVGVKAILAGPSTRTLAALRDGTDLPVDPDQERHRYVTYGQTYGYLVFFNQHREASLRHMAEQLDWFARVRWDRAPALPPAWVGRPTAATVFLGDRRSGDHWDQGRWLPFGTRLTEGYGRALGPAAINRVAWTNVEDALVEEGIRERIRRAHVVVACGRRAGEFMRDLAHPNTVRVPHPAWTYRWGVARGAVTQYERVIREVTD